MLYYIMLYYFLLYYIILYYIMLYFIICYSILLYYIIFLFYYTILYYIILCYIIFYYIILYCIIVCYIILYVILFYSILLYYIIYYIYTYLVIYTRLSIAIYFTSDKLRQLGYRTWLSSASQPMPNFFPRDKNTVAWNKWDVIWYNRDITGIKFDHKWDCSDQMVMYNDYNDHEWCYSNHNDYHHSIPMNFDDKFTTIPNIPQSGNAMSGQMAFKNLNRRAAMDN